MEEQIHVSDATENAHEGRFRLGFCHKVLRRRERDRTGRDEKL